MTFVNRTETLYFQEGSSDKEYTISLQQTDGRCEVIVHFGRRGGTQQVQNKTPEPVSSFEAVAIYERVKAEKLAKGYRPGAPAATMVVAAASPSEKLPAVAPNLWPAVTKDEEPDQPAPTKSAKSKAKRTAKGK